MGALTVATLAACNVQDFEPLSVLSTYHPMKPTVTSWSCWGFPFPFLVERAVIGSTPYGGTVRRLPLTFDDFNRLAALADAGIALFVVGFVVAWGVYFGPIMHFKPIRRSAQPRRPIQFSLRTLMAMPLMALMLIWLGRGFWKWAPTTDVPVPLLCAVVLAGALLFVTLFVE